MYTQRSSIKELSIKELSTALYRRVYALIPCLQKLLHGGDVLRERVGKWPRVPFLMLPVDRYLEIFCGPSKASGQAKLA